MMKRLRDYGITATVLAILSFAIYLMARLRPPMPPLGTLGQLSVSAVLGGIMGAVAASIGILINDWFKDKRKRKADLEKERRQLAHERRVLHYNDLIKLGRELVLLAAMIGDNIHAIKSLIQATEQGAVNFRRPVILPMDEAHFIKLADRDLVQMLNEVYYEIRRINLDSDGIGRTLDELGALVLKAKMQPVVFKAHTAHIREQMISIVDFLEDFTENDLYHITAYTRLATNADRTADMAQRSDSIVATREAPISNEAVEKEMIIVAKEVQDGMEADIEVKRARRESKTTQ